MSKGNGGSSTGLTLGSVLAIVLSWYTYQSLPWAIVHGIFGWFYVIYYIIKYY